MAEAVRRPHVKLFLHGTYRDFAGGARNVTVDAATVRDALEALLHKCPTLAERLRDEHGRLRAHLGLFVNDEDARLLGWEDATLRDGDVVHLIPALSGG